MDRLERINDLESVIRTALHAWEAHLWTALPAIIQSFDANKLTLSAQPALKFNRRMMDGTIKLETMPVITDVPVLAPRGGKCTLTFPIASGDECLLVFADRCIDGWWSNGGVQRQLEHRMHDLSDGFAIVGPFSQPGRLQNWNATAVELRSNDGQAVMQLDPTTYNITITTQTGNVSINSTQGDISITGQNITINAQQGTATINIHGNTTIIGTGRIAVNAPTILLNN